MSHRQFVVPIVAALVAAALAAGTVAARSRATSSSSPGVRAPVRVVTITPRAAPAVTVTATAPAPSQPARATSRVQGVKLRKTVAAYVVSLSCASSATHRSGRVSQGSPIDRSVAGTPGAVLHYAFRYPSFPVSEADPVVSESMRCSIRSTRTAEGAEPRHDVTLACTGEATYDGDPPAEGTSGVAEAWKLADLLDPYTHTMSAPRPRQRTEHTRCALSVVR